MLNSNILTIVSLYKSYQKARSKYQTESEIFTLEDLDIAVERGKITALIGANGSGKTTLFNIISGLTKANSGNIRFYNNDNQVDVLKSKPYQIANLGIGRMFQASLIFNQMSILDNILIGSLNNGNEVPFANLYNRKKLIGSEKLAYDKAYYILTELLGFDKAFWSEKNKLAGRLSYGQKRLLELARLLMGDYKLLLLDEPTSGIDSSFCHAIGRVLKKVVDELNVSVFLIEHNMRFVLDYADVCHFMYHGRDHHFGTPGDVLADSEVRRMYLGA